MIGRILGYNRLVLPPWWAVALFLIGYLFIDALYFIFVGWPAGDVKEFTQSRWFFLGGAAVVFAVFRASFHPAVRKEYCDWLKGTPWTAEKPLPLGPVHLIPQDGIIVGLLLLMMRTSGHGLLLVAFAFLLAYQLAIAAILLITGERWAAYGLLFCLSIAASLLQSGILGIVVLVLVFPMTCQAHRRCLAHFPWRSECPVSVTIIDLLLKKTPIAGSHLGFPYQYLSPQSNTASIGMAEGTVVCLLGGAWAHAILVNAAALVPNKPGEDTQCVISILVCIAPVSLATMARLLGYCRNYWPPISPLGRMATRRFIIPRYDRVFVAPLIAIAVLSVGSMSFMRPGASVAWGMPVVLALGLWCNLNLGPRLHNWRLTGGHRLGLGMRDRHKFVEP